MLDETGFDPAEIHLTKNRLEELRIRCTKYYQHILLEIRVWKREPGPIEKWSRTPKGVSVQITMLPLILAELEKLGAEALKAGLLASEDYRKAGLEPPPIDDP